MLLKPRKGLIPEFSTFFDGSTGAMADPTKVEKEQ
jgi:hypothetical protein